eukprot:Nk52_evm24s246 gene=Nk52_evmTU24s246
MNLSRSVPWRDASEWIHVCACLYAKCPNSGSPLWERRQEGVDSVLCWKARGGKQLPVAVECTADFVKLLITDHISSTNGGAMLNSRSLSFLYSMAFIRFFNGVVDLCQKGSHAKSVAALGEVLGLPDWFVDIRHEATHMAMPSLPVLRLGAERALAWLYTNYWTAQVGSLNEAKSQCRGEIRKYRKIQKLLLEERQSEIGLIGKDSSGSSQGKKGTAASKLENARSSILSRIVDTIGAACNVRDVAIPALLEVGILVPTKASYRPSEDNAYVSDRSLLIWGPLLHHLHAIYPQFGLCLLWALKRNLSVEEVDRDLNEIVGLLQRDCGEKLSQAKMSSEDSSLLSLQAWGVYIIETYGKDVPGSPFCSSKVNYIHKACDTFECLEAPDVLNDIRLEGLIRSCKLLRNKYLDKLQECMEKRLMQSRNESSARVEECLNLDLWKLTSIGALPWENSPSLLLEAPARCAYLTDIGKHEKESIVQRALGKTQWLSRVSDLLDVPVKDCARIGKFMSEREDNASLLKETHALKRKGDVVNMSTARSKTLRASESHHLPKPGAKRNEDDIEIF